MAAKPVRPEPVLRNGRGHDSERPAYRKKKKKKKKKEKKKKKRGWDPGQGSVVRGLCVDFPVLPWCSAVSVKVLTDSSAWRVQEAVRHQVYSCLGHSKNIWLCTEYTASTSIGAAPCLTEAHRGEKILMSLVQKICTYPCHPRSEPVNSGSWRPGSFSGSVKP